MIKATLRLLFFGLLISQPLGICHSQSPENDYETCPVTNYINYFDTTSVSFLHAPDEIQLGQARVLMKDPARCTFVEGIDLYIPTNRPGWAIALAHTHRIMTNFMGADVFNINYLHGAAFQESTYKNGTSGETWPAVADHNVASDLVLGCGFAVNHADGYFHTDANGRIFISDMYGTRFPTNGSSANLTATFEQNVHLAMMWINAFYRVNQFGRQLKMKSFFLEAADSLASTKLTAGAYVAGQLIGDIKSVVETNRATTIVAPDILPYITTGSAHNYATSVSGYTEALSTPSDIVKPAFESSQHSWYDHQITWQDVSDYLDQMTDVYIEADIPTIKTHVKSVFDGINGGGAVSFQFEFSPVIDAITGSFPYYEPEIHATQQSIYKCNYDCVLPYPTISYNTPLSFCNGLSVELTTIVGDYTYQWYKDNQLIAGAEDINYFATESGIYSIVITDANDCSLETITKAEVIVTECSSCAMTVQATSDDVTCSGYGDGSVIVTASGVTGPFTYQLDTNTPQASGSFPNLTEGNYFIEVVQTADPTCKGFASAVIDAETIITNNIILDTTEIDCEMTSLVATVIDLPPSQCTYKFIREGSNEWGSWPYQEVKVALMDGENELYNTRALENSPIPTVPQRAFEVDVSVPNGANLSIVVTTSSNSGTSISDSWWYKIVAPDGEVIANVMSHGTYQSGKTTILEPIEAICKFDRPDFVFEWTPLNVLSNTTDTTATATVSSTTLVKITATNPDDPSCPLKDSVYISNTCNGNVCIPPTRAQISSSGGINEICEGGSVFLSVDTDQPGYTIQWTYEGDDLIGANSATYSALEAGTYTVKVFDPADPGCLYESSASESFNLVVNPSVTPSITIETANTTICNGQEVNFSILSEENAGTTPSYEWFVNTTSEGIEETLSVTNLVDGDQVTVVLTSDHACASPTSATSNAATITVVANLIASLDISANQTDICEGETIDFSVLNQANEGSNPTYEWFVNGTGQSTGELYSSSQWTNSDRVSCIMTSSDACVSSPLVESNEIAVSVNENLTPDIAITSSAQEICSGELVNFSISNQSHEGNTPEYNWLVNSVPTLTGETFSSSVLEDNDVVSVTLTSSETCLSSNDVESAGITINVSTSVTPSLNITATSPTNICVNETVDFETLGGNGLGSSATYDWYVNNTQKSLTPSSTITLTGLEDGDEVTAVANGLSSCATSPTVTSNSIAISIIAPVTPTVEIEADEQTICEGESVSFEIINSSNQGANPNYQWLLNNTPITNATADSYQSTSLSNADEVKLQLTVQETCVTTQQVVTLPLLITVSPSINPTVVIDANDTTICPGDMVDFTISTITNEGLTPTYEWIVNGSVSGTESSFSTNLLTDDSKVVLNVTSSLSCLTSAFVTSNELAITVTSNQAVGLIMTRSKNPVCEDEVVNFEAEVATNSPTSYSWAVDGIIAPQSGSTLSTNSFSDGSTIMVTTEVTTNCGILTSSQEVIMDVELKSIPTYSFEEIEICSDEAPLELLASGLPSTQLTWTKDGESITGATGTTFSANESGLYGITVSSLECGDTSYQRATVNITPTPEVDAGPDLNVQQGESVVLQGHVSNDQAVQWQPSTYLDNAQMIQPTFFSDEEIEEKEIIFTVTATNGKCTATDEMTISIFNGFDVFSAFSPNGDGVNDVWSLNWIEQFPNASINVFNRWGDLIFNSVGYKQPWDGTRNGKALPIGTYYYVIDINDSEEATESLSGSLTIVK